MMNTGMNSGCTLLDPTLTSNLKFASSAGNSALSLPSEMETVNGGCSLSPSPPPRLYAATARLRNLRKVLHYFNARGKDRARFKLLALHTRPRVVGENFKGVKVETIGSHMCIMLQFREGKRGWREEGEGELH
jgi:hypothetical protein